MTPVEAYRIIQRRQINEDRILAERTSMFLLATAFLFVAFVMLLDPEWEGTIFTVLRIALPIVGIFLTILLFCFNRSASIALDFWHKAQHRIERKALDFKYMRKDEITPHIALGEVKKGEKEWVWVKAEGTWELKPVEKAKHWWQKRLLANYVIYTWYLPIAFLALWTASLVYVIVS
jgi:hypothetical protein